MNIIAFVNVVAIGSKRYYLHSEHNFLSEYNGLCVKDNVISFTSSEFVQLMECPFVKLKKLANA